MWITDTCLILVMVFIAIVMLAYVVIRLHALHITACGVEELRLIRDAKEAKQFMGRPSFFARPLAAGAPRARGGVTFWNCFKLLPGVRNKSNYIS
jgi:hypothetical protein